MERENKQGLMGISLPIEGIPVESHILFYFSFFESFLAELNPLQILSCLVGRRSGSCDSEKCDY